MHPNYGSNTLFGSGTPTEYDYINSEKIRLKHLAFLLNINTINLKQCDNFIYNLTGLYVSVADYSKNVVDNTIKIENIFNDPKVDIKKWMAKL